MGEGHFQTLNALADALRQELQSKKFILLHAHNGTGKTRLSTAFKDLGKESDADQEIELRDTLYFNAFTEDLFTWDNDLEGDTKRKLKLNTNSSFFSGLESMEMDTRIRAFLNRYVDFEFKIDTTTWEVVFYRKVRIQTNADITYGRNTMTMPQIEAVFKSHRAATIKISRGEENIFIWCFFLAVVQLAIDDDGTGPYNWVKYIYIDDPISSLDEHNAIAVAHHLAQLLKNQTQKKAVISTHHTLFFNVLWNELKNANRYVLSHKPSSQGYHLRKTDDTPFFHHVAALVELYRVSREGTLYTYHFNILRSILEKTASFHGYKHFSACIKRADGDDDGLLHTRMVNILSHGNYSLFEPQEMVDENKDYFRTILDQFIDRYAFNSDLF
ncbi:MAG: AAA family ATPase [Aestuariivita sp.]|nr:AAA family ATPase [Aestuariivita sp.]